MERLDPVIAMILISFLPIITRTSHLSADTYKMKVAGLQRHCSLRAIKQGERDSCMIFKASTELLPLTVLPNAFKSVVELHIMSQLGTCGGEGKNYLPGHNFLSLFLDESHYLMLPCCRTKLFLLLTLQWVL